MARDRKSYTAETLVKGILDSNKMLLGKSITFIESNLEKDRKIAREIINKCLPYSGNSLRIGITGVPGVGKSTFIEALGSYLITEKNKKVAVLAVDPTSKMSKGSILGDKTRMNSLANNPNAYIRPSPTSGFLGGVTATTMESMILLEAAGYDVILIETVGVGQSEIEVSEMVDFFLLLMISGAGDSLQGIKRGIMEMADSIIFNKSEGENIIPTKLAARELIAALRFFPAKESGWKTKVARCSSIKNKKIDEVWEIIEEYEKLTNRNGYLEENRRNQTLNWFKRSNVKTALENLRQNSLFQLKENELAQRVKQGTMSPFIASAKLFENLKITFD